MEEVLQGKRILDHVLNNKVPHLTRLNLFPFSFSFLRQLDKEALNQYLEQLQNMWEAYLRTKGTIQQPLFLQHLDFLQQIQIWYIRNNVLNHTAQSRPRAAKPGVAKSGEPAQPFYNENRAHGVAGFDEDEGDEDEGENFEHEVMRGKRNWREWGRAEKNSMRHKSRRTREEEQEDGEGDRGHNKARRTAREDDGKKKKIRREEEANEEDQDQHATKRRNSEERDEEEMRKRTKRGSKSETGKKKKGKVIGASDEGDEETSDVEDSKRKGTKGDKKSKSRSDNIRKSFSPPLTSDLNQTEKRNGDDYTQGPEPFQSDSHNPPSPACPIPITLSTLTTSHLQGTNAVLPNRPSIPAFQNSTNLLMHGPGPNQSPNTAQSAHPDEETRPRLDQEGELAPASLSYRDASQILLNSRPPSYRVRPDSDFPHEGDLNEEMRDAQDHPYADENGIFHPSQLMHSQDALVPLPHMEDENMQHMLHQRLLQQRQQHYQHFSQDQHQMQHKQYQQYHQQQQRTYFNPRNSTTIENPVVSGKSEKRLSRYRSSPSKALLERMEAAIASRMHVLRREPPHPDNELTRRYTILGTTGSVYTIAISNLPSCNCPDSAKGHHCCHILFVLLKILKVSQHEAVLYQRALLNAELREIYKDAPPDPQSIIGSLPPYGVIPNQAPIAGDCPICCELFAFDGEPIVWCRGRCGSNMHKSCFEVYSQHESSPETDHTFCPVCECEWVYDASMKPPKRSSERDAKPKRSKKEKLKPTSP